MPYRCVHCSATYDDASQEMIAGCRCGGRFFFYIKEDKLQEILRQQEQAPQLTAEEKEQMEHEVREITGLEDQPETSVFLDFESVKVLKPGKYLLDLSRLFVKRKPQVYQLEDGKYIVDLSGLHMA